jgi:hypothetical protein
MLQEYLRDDVKFDGFAVLLHRMNTNLHVLREQIGLIERVLDKLERGR